MLYAAKGVKRNCPEAVAVCCKPFHILISQIDSERRPLVLDWVSKLSKMPSQCPPPQYDEDYVEAICAATPEVAVTHFAKAAARNHIPSLIKMAEIAERVNDMKNAEDHLLKAKDIEPACCLLLSQFYFNQGQYDMGKATLAASGPLIGYVPPSRKMATGEEKETCLKAASDATFEFFSDLASAAGLINP
eukprot:GILJ01018983.1.p1 GENE.GILJ01018983.1~~GILJ01018983.1.p1  ORF type:complete len:190 (+),score=21.93 GILJ01018983.1:203-772(+)